GTGDLQGFDGSTAWTTLVNRQQDLNTVPKERGPIMRAKKSDTTGVTINDAERDDVERANASGLTPVAFVHGLWLLENSWDRWVSLFEKAGYVAVRPGWPDDPDSVEEGNAHPEAFAGKSIGQIADHVAEVVSLLDKKPAVIGHSFGGLLTQIVAGR